MTIKEETIPAAKILQSIEAQYRAMAEHVVPGSKVEIYKMEWRTDGLYIKYEVIYPPGVEND